MKHLIQEFLSGILSQLFGMQKPRSGKLRLTHNALTRMHEHQLDEATIEDAFRHGEQVKEKTSGTFIQCINYAAIGKPY